MGELKAVEASNISGDLVKAEFIENVPNGRCAMGVTVDAGLFGAAVDTVISEGPLT